MMVFIGRDFRDKATLINFAQTEFQIVIVIKKKRKKDIVIEVLRACQVIKFNSNLGNIMYINNIIIISTPKCHYVIEFSTIVKDSVDGTLK